MKYILMCGGNYSDRFTKPKQLLEVNGEALVERTIRLLKENGISDITISTNNPAFDYLDYPKLKSKVEYKHDDPERNKRHEKSWLNAYYPVEEPCCYIHGDVYFSEEAIKTIVETEVEDTMFFCTRDIQDGRPIGINIKGREPLAYKVQNQKVFRKAINELLEMIDNGDFSFDPISWNLYRKINGLPLVYDWFGSDIFNTKGDYKVIDDYTTDVDYIKDIEKIERLLRILKGEEKMIKVEVVEGFNLGRFNEIRNLVRANPEKNKIGELYSKDTFECTEELSDYLLGDNTYKRAFVHVIEVIPEEEKIVIEKPVKEDKIVEKKPKKVTKKKTTKKTTKK